MSTTSTPWPYGPTHPSNTKLYCRIYHLLEDLPRRARTAGQIARTAMVPSLRCTQRTHLHHHTGRDTVLPPGRPGHLERWSCRRPRRRIRCAAWPRRIRERTRAQQGRIGSRTNGHVHSRLPKRRTRRRVLTGALPRIITRCAHMSIPPYQTPTPPPSPVGATPAVPEVRVMKTYERNGIHLEQCDPAAASSWTSVNWSP